MAVGDFPLKDKITVVTGAGSGINLCFARLAVQQGARVIIADLKLTLEGESFMKTEGGKNAVFAKCDVTKRAELENLLTISEKEFGDVPDVYVAGAGVFEPAWSNWWDDTEDDGYEQINVNVTHVLKLSRLAVRALLGKNKKGVILITASLAGFQGTLAAPLYCATKHAVVGFVRSMAQLDELEDIKVCAVAPGMVHTPLWTDHPDKMAQWGYAMEISMPADEVAKYMVELITDGKYPGGTCLETSLGGTRTLGVWNIDAPPSAGTTMPEELLMKHIAPMMDICKKERGVPL